MLHAGKTSIAFIVWRLAEALLTMAADHLQQSVRYQVYRDLLPKLLVVDHPYKQADDADHLCQQVSEFLGKPSITLLFFPFQDCSYIFKGIRGPNFIPTGSTCYKEYSIE